jgi:malonate-semialdehyde dehydrogenase (acetylating) / methylmalonate-semialdehyde dehydrogenase
MNNIQDILNNANKAFESWKSLTVRKRIQYLIGLKNLIKRDFDILTELIQKEHGKLLSEAIAEVNKSIETLEYAEAGIILLSGNSLEVSSGIRCEERREPLGIVVSICPFNFPMMVPFWTIPNALMCGNCIIVKPSEKVPNTMIHIDKLFKEAQFPLGVFSLVQGTAPEVNELIKSPVVKAVTFVGSTPIAKIVGKIALDYGKKTLCLGGAKNHLIVLPDADMDLTADDVVRSFCGCTGQRCMAASVLITVGSMPILLQKIMYNCEKFKMGKVIDDNANNRINNILNNVSNNNKTYNLLLDGRGNPLKPSIIIHNNYNDEILDTEIFGPVLSVIEVENLKEAINIENTSKFGNAACIYTQSGANAEYCVKKFNSGMVGINVGVPVPREPFSFGGYNDSNPIGHHDITGKDGINFFTNKKKITTRWGNDLTIFS